MITFSRFLLKLEQDAPPPAQPPATPPAGAAPDPAAAPGGEVPGGDPAMGTMGGGAPPSVPRKSINITTWEDALRTAIKDSHQVKTPVQHNNHKSDVKEKKKPKSLFQ